MKIDAGGRERDKRGKRRKRKKAEKGKRRDVEMQQREKKKKHARRVPFMAYKKGTLTPSPLNHKLY